MKLLNKIKISLIFAFFIVILFNLKSFAVTGVITEITVNMRKEPSTNSKKIMYVTQDYKVEVLEKVGEWYKIKYEGITGYVFGKYVDVDETKLNIKEQEVEEIINENNEKQEETIQDVTKTGELKLKIKKDTDIRLIPNMISNIVYTAKDDISVDIIEQLGVWSYILVDNTYGWARTENIVEENAKQEEKTAYIKYDTVNLRQNASTSAKILAKLRLNQQVTVLEKVNNLWSKVNADGKTGYVSTELLADEKQKETQKEENTTTSRDGENTSRADKESEETVINKADSIVEEESNNKETSSNSDVKKEETTSSSTTQKDETTTSSKTKGEEIVEYAKKYLGYKYVYGGTSPKTGFDCSGFTQYVYKQFGYSISRTSKDQAKNGKEVSRSELKPGDLIIFKNQSLTAIGHVGIYIGNNKMIHSSEPGIGVVITDLDARGYNYNKRYVTARRII